MTKKAKKSSSISQKEASEAAKALELLFASEYVDKKKLYVANFWRGIYFSIGTIIGAVVIITILLWILSLFKEVPLVGPITQNIHNTVEKTQQK